MDQDSIRSWFQCLGHNREGSVWDGSQSPDRQSPAFPPGSREGRGGNLEVRQVVVELGPHASEL